MNGKNCAVWIVAATVSAAVVPAWADGPSAVISRLVADARREEPLLRRLAHVRSRPELKMLGIPKTTVGNFVLSAKLYELRDSTDPDPYRRLLESLPKSWAEMNALEIVAHAIADPGAPLADRTLYSAMFESVIQRPVYLHQVFMVASQFDAPEEWFDPEYVDWFCDELWKVRQATPRDFASTLAREPERVQRFVRSCTHQ